MEFLELQLTRIYNKIQELQLTQKRSKNKELEELGLELGPS